ncbi:hypothetical protein EC973_009083 [Apophysomyces ossiformis]|uniref:Uncharacterized protein n=1 Tax=Apophysomyces ossiformis TaxID=679940 RepID=A0A8H7BKA1_9FUNG|nr:hypothetical protein EC973_009083 [Apophysomyces ossiformis]
MYQNRQNQRKELAIQSIVNETVKSRPTIPVPAVASASGATVQNWNVEHIDTVDNRVQFRQAQAFECSASPIPGILDTESLLDDYTTAPTDNAFVTPTAAAPVDENTPVPSTSFMSDNYHDRLYPYVFSDIGSWPDNVEEWDVDGLDVLDHLQAIWERSKQGAEAGDLSDLRILEKSLSCTKYLTHQQHQQVIRDLASVFDQHMPAMNKDISFWANDLTTKEYLSSLDVKKACLDVLNLAMESKDDVSFLAASIMFSWLPRLPQQPPSAPSDVEDTHVHNYLDALLNDIYGSEPIFVQEWANGFLSTARFKPDWVAFVKPWFTRFDIGVCEVKTTRTNAGVFSDYVKLGLEMRDMLNELIKQGLDHAQVCGILVKETYVMDLKWPVYRMVMLSSVRLPDSVATFSLFPSVFRAVLQTKNIATSVVHHLDELQASLSKGKRKLSATASYHHTFPKCTRLKE